MAHHRSPPPRRAADVAQHIWCINFTLVLTPPPAPFFPPPQNLLSPCILLFKQNYVMSALNHWI